MEKRSLGKILAERAEKATNAVSRLSTLLSRERLTESELEEVRQLRKVLNIKSLAAKGIAVASVAVLSGCAVLDPNGWTANAEIGITAVEQRSVTVVGRKASQRETVLCEYFGKGCQNQASGVTYDK